ncbi:hypothetical protein SELMODRAFT_5884, partial [Selaginella moellendorffii]
VPTIAALQQWLEIAWSKGFDSDGAEHFNGAIYGSQKWIGTTECAALLRLFGVRARIVDFKALTRTTGGKDYNHQRLVDWVWNYYTEEDRDHVENRQPLVIISRRPPLYFQHQGHSRTIVGIQRRRKLGGPEEAFLLVFDP